MLKTRVSRPFFEQICSKPAFPGLPCTWNARNPLFYSAFWLSLPRPSSWPGNHAQAASTSGTLDLLAMKRRQQAQVKPLAALGTRESRTGSQHRWSLWLRGNEALAARTGQTAGRMAVKRTQAARLEPWCAAIAPSKHCPTCWALRCAQAAGTGGTFSELGTLHGGSPSGLQMAQRQTAQLKPASPGFP